MDPHSPDTNFPNCPHSPPPPSPDLQSFMPPHHPQTTLLPPPPPPINGLIRARRRVGRRNGGGDDDDTNRKQSNPETTSYDLELRFSQSWRTSGSSYDEISVYEELPRSCVLLKRLVNKDTNPNETVEVFSLLNFDRNNDDGGGEVGFDVEDINIPPPIDLRDEGSSLHIIGNCNGIICLVQDTSSEVILWNPATHEFKTLPSQPYPPPVPEREIRQGDFPPFRQDIPVPECVFLQDRQYMHSLGFGYDPKSNDYKVINIGWPSPDKQHSRSPRGYVLQLPPKTAVYSLSTDSWREMKSFYLETETTILLPQRFHMCFKGMCYWSGQELHKVLDVYEAWDEEPKNIMILFDTGDEVFHYMLLPDRLYDRNVFCGGDVRLLVWNESIALFGLQNTTSQYRASFGIWVMDGAPKGSWTKHITFEVNERPLAFLNIDEILMVDTNNEESRVGRIFSYNLVTRRIKYLHGQTMPYSKAVVYGNYSTVSLLGGMNKLQISRDNSTNAGYSLGEHSSSPSASTVDNVCCSYSVWAMPPDDVSCRIKKVMEGLRSEFGGPEIEPHIPVVASIRMTHEDALNEFRSLHSWVTSHHIAKVSQVDTRPFYYQCVCLPIDIYPISPHQDSESFELWQAIRTCSMRFGVRNHDIPHLSLLYGNLTEEDRKKAQEKVRILDEGITSMSFPLTRLALYKIDYTDKSLKSWKKIAEYTRQYSN